MAETLQDLINQRQERGTQIKKIYFIEAGTYPLNKRLVINEPNVALVGIGEVTLVKAKSADGVYVEEGGNGFCMLNIKVVDSVCDEDGCCLVVKANNTLIENCCFDRRNVTKQKFTVFYPGPEHRGNKCDSATIPTALSLYFAVNSLHTGNVFRDNIVRSGISCDNLSFSLQSDGHVEKNKIEGSLAAFMLRNCQIIDNYIINPAHIDGIPLFVSLPAEDVTIEGNRMISEPFNQHPPTVIRINIQADHPFNPEDTIRGDSRTISVRIKSDTDITIKNNRYKMAKGAKFLDKRYEDEFDENCKRENKNDTRLNLDIGIKTPKLLNYQKEIEREHLNFIVRNYQHNLPETFFTERGITVIFIKDKPNFDKSFSKCIEHCF